MFHLFAIYLFLTSFIETYHSSDIKRGLAYIFIDVLSVFLWYSMRNKKKNLQTLILFANSNHHLSGASVNKNYDLLINNCILINVISTILLATLFTCLAHGEDDAVKFWTFGVECQSKTYKTVLNFIGGLAYYAVYTEYPSFFALSICILVYRYGLILRHFNEYIKNMDFSTISNKCFEIANTYFVVEEKVRLLKDTLSLSLFLMLVSGFFNIYTALSNVLTNEIPLYVSVELSSNAFTGGMIIFLLTIYCSRIPEYMIAIRQTLGSVIDKNQIAKLNMATELRLLKRIENKDAIYMSAVGVIYFKKSFLLPAFGTVLTYSVLIVKLN
ncbi:uncharacterized protein NPIL_113671 [Nephila pilipes]|uniref:Gustatory receptor n=1 Tax=Nephila pilipes TaxID=299642 RepID=A0A8X6PTF9_NEPPI|nr:uncharacterized protein NPIL_113671 [Nephila pilipes]